MKVRNYQDLIVWQKSMDFVEEVYSFSKVFPKEEAYGLTSQLRRAVVSIPSNIAEGQGRTTADFCRHLSIAYGSLREAETQILIAKAALSVGRPNSLLNEDGWRGGTLTEWLNGVTAGILASRPTAHCTLLTSYCS